MITGALKTYLENNLSLTAIYVNQAPLDAGACVVIDDDGDLPDRHWEAGQTVTGTRDQDYELTVWADLTEGGSFYADQIADECVQLLDNFAGTMTDGASSPSVAHRVLHIAANKNGGGFDAGPERYGQSIFLTVMYA